MTSVPLALAAMALASAAPAKGPHVPAHGAQPKPAAEAAAASTPRQRSAGAERVAAWIASSADNQGLPYIIIDKPAARAYLFNAKGKPDKWVSALLESLNPKPNTVMLAVASNDGNLVVAVSSNSEEWLKKKSTVDALSDAAQKPLMESDPDWAKSATDMMNQISVQKKTSTSSRTIWIGVGGFAGALLLLVVILVVFHILRKKGVIGHRRKGRHSGRHGAVAERIQPVKEWGAESENEDYVNPDTASTQDSESVQETSSEASDA